MKKLFKLFGIAALVAVIGFAVSAGFTACDMGSNTTATVLPKAPTGLKVSLSGSNQVTLTWNAVPNATRYIVYQSFYRSFEDWLTPTRDLLVNSAVIPLIGSASAGVHYFRVKATNSYGESGYSKIATLRIR